MALFKASVAFMYFFYLLKALAMGLILVGVIKLGYASLVGRIVMVLVIIIAVTVYLQGG